MNPEADGFKTNEFLRRRKLRLQQVREQSKDIAKKIRQRAKVEKLRQVVELDAKKQSDYLLRQDKLIKQLEEYYSKGIKNVGASHRSAADIKAQDDLAHQVDISKQRGKEAATELRKKRQQVLDEHKRKLDRKLQAREAANVISREKSVSAVNKVIPESTEAANNNVAPNDNTNTKNGQEIARNDMGTQWDLEEIPNEWEPNVPKLSLPKDDNSIKESNNNVIDSKSDKSKRLDLFALSDEMPSSLRGVITNHEENIPAKSSLTLVSEYLKNRGLRLRESDTGQSRKKTEDLQSLKETIHRTRASKEGIFDACQVHDEELVPVPTWHAEKTCGFFSHTGYVHNDKICRPASTEQRKKQTPFTVSKQDFGPNPVLRGVSPYGSIRNSSRRFSAKFSNTQSNAAPRKPFVTTYNHSTRDIRDIPCRDESLVVRETQTHDDAYSLAMKESNTNHDSDRGSKKKIQEIRSKVAMTKQNIEREYKDTMTFLNSLPKDKGEKPITKTAFMNEDRQQMQKDTRQQKLNQEFRRIQKECAKHSCRNRSHKHQNCSKNNDDAFENSEFQYSWMPVPEGDDNLAVHTIPTTLSEGKSGNTVKFSKVDSYHEYRSRHKHTPPTKDTAQKKPAKTVLLQNSSDTESVSSDSSQNLRLETRDSPKVSEKLSDAERIIIYKILDSKAADRTKTTKLMKDIAKSLSMIEKQNFNNELNHTKDSSSKKSSSNVDNRVSFEQLNEGIYQAVTEKGDNITSMYFKDNDENKVQVNADELNQRHICFCKKKPEESTDTACLQWESGDLPSTSRLPQKTSASICRCGSKIKRTTEHPLTATSTSSFQTSTNDKTSNVLTNEGFLKFVDNGGQEDGKFYIGASGLLKNDAYEVVIQVRKKGDEKENKEMSNEQSDQINTTTKVIRNIETLTTNNKDSVVQNGPSTTQLNTENEPSKIDKRDQVTSASPVTQKQEIKKTEDAVVNVMPEDLNNAISKASVTYKEKIDSIGAIPTNEPNKFAEKGVSTSFQDSYAIPSTFSKAASIPRPATSTYTQTSMSSPNHRPVYFHMSSSTSTAYMSPPEMILPKFLRQDYQLTDEEVYDPRNYEMNPPQDHECACRTCKRENKLIEENVRYYHRCKKGKVYTPPNSVRSARFQDRDNIFLHQEHSENVVPPLCIKKHKCKCRKCESSSCFNKLNTSNSRKNLKHLLSATQNRNVALHVASSKASSNNQRNVKNTKINLKPVIKDYVDKLLVLNRESLRAVHVMDQECSSVSTPSSSIIEAPNNIDSNKPPAGNTISLQQISNLLIQRKENKKKHDTSTTQNSEVCLKKHSKCNKQTRLPRKRTGHKLKSLNISKRLYHAKKVVSRDSVSVLNPPMTQTEYVKEHSSLKPCKKTVRSKSSPTPRLAAQSESIADKSANSDRTHLYANRKTRDGSNVNSQKCNQRKSTYLNAPPQVVQSNRVTRLISSSDSERNVSSMKGNNIEIPMSISTQTSVNVDSELNYMKLAEDKLHNMEKIADLTEKCTQRLSNLARVLEEVRKNKSLVYNQISTSDNKSSASESDNKSDKNSNNITPPSNETSNVNVIMPKTVSPVSDVMINQKEVDNKVGPAFVPFLSDIPKPVVFENLNSDIVFNISSSSSKKSYSPSSNLELINYEHSNKTRAKPPPALSRIHLRHVQENVVPHELSTVVEVDSPMSVKMKSSRNDTKLPDMSNNGIGIIKEGSSQVETQDTNSNELLVSNVDVGNRTRKISNTDSDNSKVQMIDMNKFNEIMLKPFFSLQEYAKQCNIGTLEDCSNLDENVKDVPINDEFSSLHSDGSLPDVISELLKRKIISEPFKFDTGSNANSTTVSSESTYSVLALSRARQRKKKTSLVIQNKENIGETSDTLSISSNPDLENAFRKLGMGWASSTLKKTKERLALSSSSNTSSSSLTRFKMKGYQDIPAIVTDTVSSVTNISNKAVQLNPMDSSKNAEQQTSLTKSMTVKEFLTNELAKKITFNNKSTNDTEEEFMSLFETKMPEEMKHSSRVIREENSVDNSMRSGNNNRARTSTPVQLYKSSTYQSSSSSNMSNGLFSNADDLSSVKVTSNSIKHSTSDKDDLIIPNLSLRIKRGSPECSKSE